MACLDMQYSALILLPNRHIVATSWLNPLNENENEARPAVAGTVAYRQDECKGLQRFTELFLLHAYPTLLSEAQGQLCIVSSDRILLMGEYTEQYRRWTRKPHLH